MARLDDATGSVVARQRLDAHPSSVSSARRLVTHALGELGRAELADDAALAVSELVTNALVHAGTAIEVIVSQHDADVVVEVVDDSPRLPFVRHHAELAGTGRGLQLVEQLTAAWGTKERPPGKSVWFQVCRQPVAEAEPGRLGTVFQGDLEAWLAAFPDEQDHAPAVPGAAPPKPSEPSDPSDPSAHRPEQVVEVVLLHVPLLLHAAWQMQAESVLREYLLTRLAGSDESIEEELEAHAAVHEAVVLLQEHVPAPDLGEHPEQLMAAAVEPLVSAERLIFPVPVASLANFVLMDSTLDAALRLADSGALLTPPTPPEIRAFRRWLCRQVREQEVGGDPEPWRADLGSEVPLAVAPPAWDPVEVLLSADIARIAAADTNRIMAVSPAAARLLGYPSEDELVGRRLVDIIPERFRQAHVAGVTLHLFAGRSPLLGKRVTVPALRRDGSEITVELLVQAVSLTGGRHVFLAELSEPRPAAAG